MAAIVKGMARRTPKIESMMEGIVVGGMNEFERSCLGYLSLLGVCTGYDGHVVFAVGRMDEWDRGRQHTSSLRHLC